MLAIDEIEKEMKNNLSDFRYNHSLMVAKEAKLLARHYHYDEEKAYFAGLLHDIAKEFSEEENKRIIKKYHLNPDIIKNEFKAVAHALIGALVAKERYCIDNEIYNAICYHSIGNIEMSTLDKIIFIADKIGRDNLPKSLQEVKEIAYKNLDNAIFFFLKNQKKYLESNGKIMHKNSLKLLDKLNQY